MYSRSARFIAFTPVSYTHLDVYKRQGLTGGEPLLDLENALRFLGRAGELWPGAHKRLYTSGDLLTVEAAARLRDAGLDEILSLIHISWARGRSYPCRRP